MEAFAEPISLATLADGPLGDSFDDEFARCLRDIVRNPNEKKARTIKFKVEVKPTHAGRVEVIPSKAEATLSPKKWSVYGAVRQRGDDIVAIEDLPRFGPAEPEPPTPTGPAADPRAANPNLIAPAEAVTTGPAKAPVDDDGVFAPAPAPEPKTGPSEPAPVDASEFDPFA